MKPKTILSSMTVMLVTSIILTGCGTNLDREVTTNSNPGIHNEPIPQKVQEGPNFEAIVLEKNKSTITVSPIKKAEQPYILVTTGIDYMAKVGDKVRVWTTGQYEDRYPSQGVATQIDQIK